MRVFQDYDRAAAVAYAHTWAYRRNPRYYNYEELGGDCTNFSLPVSLCRRRHHELYSHLGLVLSGCRPQGTGLDGGTVPLEFFDPHPAVPWGRWGKRVPWKISSPAISCSFPLTGRLLAIRPLSSQWNSPFPLKRFWWPLIPRMPTSGRCPPMPTEICAACGLPASYGPENNS